MCEDEKDVGDGVYEDFGLVLLVFVVDQNFDVGLLVLNSFVIFKRIEETN